MKMSTLRALAFDHRSIASALKGKENWSSTLPCTSAASTWLTWQGLACSGVTNMIKESLQETELRMKGAISALEDDLGSIRTGRASTALVEKLLVTYYGTPTPLLQLATIAIPEPQMITIRPFDPGSINDIERAIQTSDLGLTPMNDGKLIRLSVPPLTEDRRQELVKVVYKRMEEAKVAVRNIRRDVLDDLREFEKEKMISEDDFYRGKDDLQKLTDKYIGEVDVIGERKEKEIREV
jgi:ribosome recycling factor